MTRRPITVPVTLIFLLLNAVIWLGFGAEVGIDAQTPLPVPPVIRTAMAGLSVAAAGVLLALCAMLARRSRAAYFLTLGFLGVVSLLFAFDQFGWLDLGVLVINIIPIILLVKDREWYISPKPAASKENPKTL